MSYSIRLFDQGGGLRLLRKLGAYDEIEAAVLEQYRRFGDKPPKRQLELKKLLAERGWQKEVRVPPYHAGWDWLAINERFDAWKPFPLGSGRAGVAIEIEDWAINNDLLKFRRAFHRGQIHVGVIVHDTPGHLDYCYEHMRHLSEPLFGHLPLVFLAPEGGEIEYGLGISNRQFGPFLMP